MAMGVKRVFAHKKLSLTAAAAIAAAAMGSSATISSAAITVNGTWSSDFGNALTTQTINTSFGDGAYSGTYNGHSADTNGSELDAGYGVIENGYLYLLLTGDLEDNGNHLNIFIADGRTGQSTFEGGTGQTLDAINGCEWIPKFRPRRHLCFGC